MVASHAGLKTSPGHLTAMLRFVLLLVALATSSTVSRTGRRVVARAGGRSSLQFLQAVAAWKKVSARGLDCPAPEPCSCHCDCPNTEQEVAPPPPPPCPTATPPFPTFAPPTTPAPIQTTVAQKVNPLRNMNANDYAMNGPLEECKECELRMSDGTCAPITDETMQQILEIVAMKKAELDDIEAQFKARRQGVNCKDCVNWKTDKLTHAHEQYKIALELYLAMAQCTHFKKKDDMQKLVAESGGDGDTCKPEYLPSSCPTKAYQHCLLWTQGTDLRNVTDNCALICRNMANCKGFAVDASRLTCVWWEHAPGSPANASAFVAPGPRPLEPRTCLACSGMTNIFAKMEQICDPEADKPTEDHKCSPAIRPAVVRIASARDFLEKSLQKVNQTQHDAEISFSDFRNASQPFEMRYEGFRGATETYAYAINDVAEMKAEIKNGMESAKKVIDGMKGLDSLCGILTPATTTTTTTTTKVYATPVPLEWKMFRNAEDSDWSEHHPECPQGPPCLCECKCRGAPPQNIEVEPPPPPPPCPPLPPPPPKMAFFR